MKLTANQRFLLLTLFSEAEIPMNGKVQDLIKTAKDLEQLKRDIENAELIEEEDENDTE